MMIYIYDGVLVIFLAVCLGLLGNYIAHVDGEDRSYCKYCLPDSSANEFYVANAIISMSPWMVRTTISIIPSMQPPGIRDARFSYLAEDPCSAKLFNSRSDALRYLFALKVF
jgi:hypothetical protein